MEKLICQKCNKELELANATLEYLEHKMTHQFLACPECKAVFIPEETVNGKIHQLEMNLEDK